jgi:hydrogenase maturation factor HypF (carbamoyltransferase family)
MALNIMHRLIMECPICLAEARNLTPRTYQGLIVGCPRCGVYRVMKAAIGALPRLKVEKRLEALTKAKIYTSPKAWPTISNACL